MAFVSQKVTTIAILIYVAALLTCNVLFLEYAMEWYFWIFGLVEVCSYFYFANKLTKDWASLRPRTFIKNLFWSAFMIRIAVMLFLYWFHTDMTGQPFMYAAGDAIGYHEEAKWIARLLRDGQFSTYLDYKFGPGKGVSDAGYPMYLGFVYWLTWDSIIIARLLKCLWGALSCILIYRLGKRNFGEQVGRIAGILMMLESHFWIYGGMHLKETEMVFVLLLFLDRADALLRYRKFNFATISVVVLLMAALFTFRTVLGLTALFSIGLTLFLSSKRVMNWSRRVVVLIVVGMTALYFVGGRITIEIEEIWERKDDNQNLRMSEIVRTQGFAKYVGAAVYAPMIFTIPFPTMVATEGQQTSRMLHGGMVTKNIMSYFCILAIATLLLPIIPKKNKWRDHVLIGSFLIAYLVILTFSAFAHANRFHMPALALEILFMAYGVSLLSDKRWQRAYNWWIVVMFVAFVGWNWFKLAGRGLA